MSENGRELVDWVSDLLKIQELLDKYQFKWIDGYTLGYDPSMPGFILYNDVSGVDLGETYESAERELAQLVK